MPFARVHGVSGHVVDGCLSREPAAFCGTNFALRQLGGVSH